VMHSVAITNTSIDGSNPRINVINTPSYAILLNGSGSLSVPRHTKHVCDAIGLIILRFKKSIFYGDV
jgi:hypothetical protein